MAGKWCLFLNQLVAAVTQRQLRCHRWTRRWSYGMLSIAVALLCLWSSPTAATVPVIAQHLSQPSPTRDALRLDQQGRSLLTAGRFPEAVVALERAVLFHQLAGDGLRHALSLANLALAQRYLGQWPEANQAIARSQSLLADLPDDAAKSLARAQILDILGSLRLAQGQPSDALQAWEDAAALFQQLDQPERAIATQLNQAQALQDQGRHRRAMELLYQVAGLARSEDGSDTMLRWLQVSGDEALAPLVARLDRLATSPTTASALQGLGRSLLATSYPRHASLVLERGLTMAQSLGDGETIAILQIQRGNLAWGEAIALLRQEGMTLDMARQQLQAPGNQITDALEIAQDFQANVEDAIGLYQQARRSARSPQTRLQAALNQFRLHLALGQLQPVLEQIAQVQADLAALPVSRFTIYATINLAQHWADLAERNLSQVAPLDQANQLLLTALEQARRLGDMRAEAQSLGNLGRLLENRRPEEAATYTRQAILLSQSVQSADMAYQWQWQLGRLLKARSDREGAIAAYQEAVRTLNTIREELAAVSQEQQFSFRETVEPIHRELVALLLEGGSRPPGAEQLLAAREAIESLQLAELDNFFRAACLDADPALVESLEGTAAVFYPIILPDKLAVIVSLPQPQVQPEAQPAEDDRTDAPVVCDALKPTRRPQTQTPLPAPRQVCYFATELKQETVETTVRELQDQLLQTGENRYEQPAERLYDWLIRPIDGQLGADNTLVFVLDGILRSVPMAVLKKGDEFLIQRHSIAYTSGLQLLDGSPSQIRDLQALVGGLSVERPGFSELPKVKDEAALVGRAVNGNVLLDATFTGNNFRDQVGDNPFPIVHLATHGEFSSRSDDTFILTYDRRLTIDELRTLLQTVTIRQRGALELLVLSACQTARGDNRAALGMAGVALRSGARSTLATLWLVSDDSTVQLMEQFYARLTAPSVSRAEALRQAQLALIGSEFSHPFYWSPFILLGDWRPLQLPQFAA